MLTGFRSTKDSGIARVRTYWSIQRDTILTLQNFVEFCIEKNDSMQLDNDQLLFVLDEDAAQYNLYISTINEFIVAEEEFWSEQRDLLESFQDEIP